MATQYVNDSLQNFDSWDLVSFVMVLIGAGVMSNGVVIDIFGLDPSNNFYTLAGTTLTIANGMVIGGAGWGLITNVVDDGGFDTSNFSELEVVAFVGIPTVTVLSIFAPNVFMDQVTSSNMLAVGYTALHGAFVFIIGSE